MQELQNYEEDKKDFVKWTIEFEKHKNDFEESKKEIQEIGENFRNLSTKKHSIVDDVVGRKLRKCEEKYFTEKMK